MEAVKDAIKVIDADVPPHDIDDLLKPYLPEPYRSRRAPLLPRETFDRNLGGTLGHAGVKLEERLAAMDTQQIDTAVLYPTSGLGIGRGRGKDYSVARSRAYNDFISDYCKGSPRRKAVANLPVNEPEAAAAELRRAVTKLGLCGGMLAAQAHSKNLGSAEFHPLYKEAEALETPIAIHAFGGDEPGTDIFEQFIAIHTCGRS